MKLCPTCSAQYDDDANFCPMDATRLQVVAPPRAPAAAPVDAGRAIGGRFFLASTTPVAVTATGMEYEASDGEGGPPVRVKIIDQPALPTAMMVERALREFKQLAKVASNRIAHVVDQGKTEQGNVFVATAALPGETLEQLILREGALSFERAKAIVIAVGEALSEAQKVGVVHRDVAPQNVLLADDRVVLTGFGVAPPLTDRVFGTPAFLSPEQAEGKPVDQRSNIYSLGTLLYFALTGSTPFEASEITSEPELLIRQHLHAQPIPPSQRRPGLTPEIDKVLLKALEKSGGRRHLTLRQLINEIDALVPPASLAAVQAPSTRTPAIVPVLKPAPEVARERAPAQPALKPEERRAEPSAPKMVPAAVAREPVMVAPAPMPAATAPAGGSAKLAVEAAPAAPAIADIHVAPTARVAPGPDAPKAVPVEGSAAAKAAAPAAKPKKKFRETGWFKKGELEDQAAQKAAQANADDPLAGPVNTEVIVDESSLTDEDRARFSLRSSGGTESMPVIRRQASFGERMSEAEMLAEVDSSKKWIVIAGIVIGAVAIVALILFLTLRGSSPKPPATPPAAAQTR